MRCIWYFFSVGIVLSMSSYRSIVKSLYKINVDHPVNLGLENAQALYRLLDFPLKKKLVVHVAGTNGKGSVCFKIAEVFRRNNMKVGLYVSPHISSFRERILTNGSPISEYDVVVSPSSQNIFIISQRLWEGFAATTHPTL